MTVKKTKKAPGAGAPRAISGIAIDGVHFDAGEEITGVDPDQVAIALASRRVISAEEYAARTAALEAEAGAADQDADAAADAAAPAAADAAGNPDASTGDPAAG